MSARAIVVGGGAFGVPTAIALRERGMDVLLVDPGPVPHPDAATTDLSKLVRADYGADGLYSDLMVHAFERWREHNRTWCANGERALFHETGFRLLSSEPMAPGGFEHDSYELLSRRGYPLERLDASALRRRFPVLGEGRFVDGYYNRVGGWAESGAALAAFAREARRRGVLIEEGFRFASFLERGGRTAGVVSDDGRVREGDVVVLAAGTWTAKLLPELADRLRSSGQPVFVFRPADAASFAPPRFVPWAADIGRTGWYGFSTNADGLVKVANHGVGVHQDPDARRAVSEHEEGRFRGFLRGALPGLADAPVELTRLCFYSDCFDGDFFIGAHPERPGLVVAAGDSGHAFKFMPVLGDLVADAVESRSNAYSERFGWRALGPAKAEQARCPT